MPLMAATTGSVSGDHESAPVEVETHRTKDKVRRVLSDPQQIERDVRQLLANKISGNLVGLWLLIPDRQADDAQARSRLRALSLELTGLC